MQLIAGVQVCRGSLSVPVQYRLGCLTLQGWHRLQECPNQQGLGAMYCMGAVLACKGSLVCRGAIDCRGLNGGVAGFYGTLWGDKGVQGVCVR